MADEKNSKTDKINEIQEHVSGTVLLACTDGGTPLIDEDGTKTCNCLDPTVIRMIDRWECMECWGVYYR